MSGATPAVPGSRNEWPRISLLVGRGEGRALPSASVRVAPSQVPPSFLPSSLPPKFNYSSIGVVLGSRSNGIFPLSLGDDRQTDGRVGTGGLGGGILVLSPNHSRSLQLGIYPQKRFQSMIVCVGHNLLSWTEYSTYDDKRTKTL